MSMISASLGRAGLWKYTGLTIRLAAEFGDGFDKIYQRLRKAGYTWNHKKIYRVYRKMLFNKRSILEDAISCNGKPDCIRTDNGPEFISDKLKIWCMANGIQHKFTQPGKPTQNSYIERFNGSYRRAILDAYIFRNLDEVREITEKWRHDYNYNRPHEALGNMTPIEYKQRFLNKNINFDVRLLGKVGK